MNGIKVAHTLIILLIITSLSSSCSKGGKKSDDEESNDNVTRTVDPSEADPAQENTDSSEEENNTLVFGGVSLVDEITYREALVHWEKVEGAASYSIFLKKQNEEDYLFQGHTSKAGKRYRLRSLEAGESYSVMIKVMDMYGAVYDGENSFEFTTESFTPFENTMAADFDGSYAFSLGYGDELITQQSFTTIFWIKTDDTSSEDARIINYRNQQGGSSVNLHLRRGELFLGYRDENNDYFPVDTDFVIADNNWHQIALIRSAKHYQVYVDGVRILSHKATMAALGHQEALLASFNGSSNFYRGLIDEVSLWKGAFGRQQVEEIYHNGLTYELRNHSRYRQLIQWWRLGDLVDDTGAVFTQDAPATN